MATTSLLPSEIPIEKLTTGSFNGTGVMDKLMSSTHSYIDHEFKEGRIKGPEYAQVCLGMIQAAMQNGVGFLLQQQKAALEAKLIEAQIRLADKQVEIAEAELALKEAELPRILAEIAKLNVEVELLQASKPKIAAEIELINVNIARGNAELPKVEKEIAVLVAQECKLRAEFDLTQQTVLKAGQESALLAQKVTTERAQTQSTGVDPDSVVGRQKDLYAQQAKGFQRDAEQKVAKIMVDSWNVRRSTDESTQANTTNRLDDATVGNAVSRMLAGVSA